MAKEVNRMHRIHRIFKKAYDDNGKKACIDAWGDILNISQIEQKNRRFEVIGLLRKLHEEIQIARSIMEATNYSKELYENAFQRIEIVISIEQLMNNWGAFRSHVSSEVISHLQWCAETLPCDERLIEEKDLSALRKEIEELKKSVLDDDLPVEVKNFVLHQIAIIEKAILEYPIVGIKAFAVAEEQAVMDYILNQNIIKTESKRIVFEKLGNAWQKVRVYIDDFSKILHLLKDAGDLYQSGKGFLNQ